MHNALALEARPLTLSERGMYLDGRDPIANVLPIEIRGRLSEPRLRHALARLQQKHRLLRCLIVYRDGRPWYQEQSSPPPIALRILARASANDWLAQTGEEEARLFDPGEPLVRLTWLRGEMASELLLTCHHCLCDGRSIVTLLRELLLLHDTPERDIGRDDSLHAIAELLPDSVLNDRTLQRRTRWMAALFRVFIRCVPTGPALTYDDRYTLRWVIDAATLQALTRRCEAEGISVFGALCVAFVLGFRHVCGARAVRKFTVPVDARKFLSNLQTDQLFPIAPTVTLPLETPRSGEVGDAEFWRLAQTLKADMWKKIELLGAKFRRLLFGMEHLHPVYKKMLAIARSRRPLLNPTLSYLGRLDLARDYEEFRIEAAHSPSARLMPSPLVVVSRFAECLDISFVADEKCLSRERAAAVRDAVMTTLRERALWPAATIADREPAIPSPSAAVPTKEIA